MVMFIDKVNTSKLYERLCNTQLYVGRMDFPIFLLSFNFAVN